MIHALEQIRRYSNLDTPVLVEGETGTGKELAAKALHSLSDRAANPFVIVDCGSLSETLIESELFGHERGSYTGADRFYAGRIQAAHGGTLFLDEVNSVSPQIQTKLLRFLETQEFCRVGQQRPVAVDVRLVTASNIPLHSLVAKQLIRRDFFYRINVLRLELPTLNERVDDLPLLVDGFLRSDPTAKRLGVTALPATLLDELRARSWPGNVRELHNTLRRLVALGAGAGECLAITERSRMEAEPVAAAEHAQRAYSKHLPFRSWMREREREYFMTLVQRHSSVAEQAAAAKLPQRTLYRKLRSHQIRSKNEPA